MLVFVFILTVTKFACAKLNLFVVNQVCLRRFRFICGDLDLFAQG